MRVRLLCLFCFLLVLPKFASADTIYTYTGNDFTTLANNTTSANKFTTSDFVSGFFDLSSPLAANLPSGTVISPTDFSFSDGVDTVSLANFSVLTVQVGTDSTGKIISWNIDAESGSTFPLALIGTAKVTTLVADSGSEILGVSQFGQARMEGSNASDAGTWTSETVTGAAPEPSGLVLLGTGMAGLLGVASRRLRRQAPHLD
jgi:hypothetical protein